MCKLIKACVINHASRDIGALNMNIVYYSKHVFSRNPLKSLTIPELEFWVEFLFTFNKVRSGTLTQQVIPSKGSKNV